MTNPTNAPQGANAPALPAAPGPAKGVSSIDTPSLPVAISVIPTDPEAIGPNTVAVAAFWESYMGRDGLVADYFEHGDDDLLESRFATLAEQFRNAIATAGPPVSVMDALALASLQHELLDEAAGLKPYPVFGARGVMLKAIADQLVQLSPVPKPTHGDAARAFRADYSRLLDAVMRTDAHEGDVVFEAVEAALVVLATRFREALAAAGPVVSPDDVPVLEGLRGWLMDWDEDGLDFPGIRNGINAGTAKVIAECLGGADRGNRVWSVRGRGAGPFQNTSCILPEDGLPLGNRKSQESGHYDHHPQAYHNRRVPGCAH